MNLNRSSWRLLLLLPLLGLAACGGDGAGSAGEVPTSTGPAGLALASDGTVYYADLAIVEQPPPTFFGPAAGEGTVRKVTFDENGTPSLPEIIASGLSFPDAVSVLPLP